LQYTEILPKTLGVRYNKRFAFWVARPLWFATKFGAPIIRFIRLCNKPFEPRGGAGDALSSIQELRVLTTVAEDSKQIDEEQADVILETLDLNKTTVREIMTPIDEAKTLDAELTLEEAMKKAIEDGHTRFPIADAQGRVERYVNFKEIARGVARKQLNGEVFATDGGSEIDKIARELLVVSPDAVASEMMQYFVDESQHIAVVRDEATGENVGILTLEDIVEEMLGEIKDEFDSHNRIDATTDALLCGGGCELADVVKEIEEKFPGRCAEAVAALKKFDATATDESAVGWETRRLNAWFRSQLPKTQKKVLRVSSVALGDLRIDAHNVQYGQLKEAIIRLRDGAEK
ncbi:MAG: CBS domain-containing protein, partial [Thermoguttaceae bacterium]|nr:CBS domain-containing protein [Thermoguttaceae bacterium]